MTSNGKGMKRSRLESPGPDVIGLASSSDVFQAKVTWICAIKAPEKCSLVAAADGEVGFVSLKFSTKSAEQEPLPNMEVLVFTDSLYKQFL